MSELLRENAFKSLRDSMQAQADALVKRRAEEAKKNKPTPLVKPAPMSDEDKARSPSFDFGKHKGYGQQGHYSGD